MLFRAGWNAARVQRWLGFCLDAPLRRPLTRLRSSDIVGDVVEWFDTRAEAEQFIAEVACEPNLEDAVIARALSVGEVEFEASPY
jgi:hypothetical protein